MRIIITLFLSSFLFITYGQEIEVDEMVIDATGSIEMTKDSTKEDSIPKYQSLFWKIEHPDYDQPSYLYGTMHVSHKIAYHLNDAFYQALKDVDQIALETNPEDWMDKMLEGGGNPYGRGGGGLYSSFAPIAPEKEDIKAILQMNNQIVNGILYRNSEYQQNFEEETYLDMFIFQAGSKMGKPVVALEDIDEADELARKAQVSAYDPNKEYSPWLKKKLNEKGGIVQLTEDAYRDKNLDLIDSLNREYYSKDYNQYMLYDRNWNMVVALDSVLEKGTVLVGIGAAHLPGEDGVIDMLRKEGFTVTPISGELTQTGIDLKENFENKFAEREHKDYTSADGFISLELPDKLHEFGFGGRSIGLSMDITNGAYFVIYRTPSYEALHKENISLDEIDDMLYENIPGKIKKQERIDFRGYPAIYIANETKSGEHQRYIIVHTPLEIIVMKLGGKKDYATKFEKKFLDAIQLESLNQDKNEAQQPFYGDYSVQFPKTSIIGGNSKTLSEMGIVEMQAIDTLNDEYYFAKSIVYNDLRYFEEDEFEVEYLHKVWYDELDTTHEQIVVKTDEYAYAISQSHTKTDKEVWLKSMKKGPRYYMLGTVGVNEKEAKAYFDTFKWVPYVQEDEKYELRDDTSLYFTVESPVEAPPYFDYYASTKTDKDTIGNIYKSVTYETPYKEFINVNYRKYHSYYQTENIDSVWIFLKRRWEYDNNDEQTEVFDEAKGETPDGYPTYSFKVRSKDCSRVIHNYYYLNHGLMYHLNFDSYADETPSGFVDTFLKTFSPKDTLVGRSPLADKRDMFFENIHSQDSIVREQALSAYSYVDFVNDDIPKLIDIIKNFNFTDKELNIKVGLLEELGKMEDPRVFTFLRDLYVNSEYNSIIQLEVINTIAKNPSDANMKSILSLMKEDIPLSSTRAIDNAFAPLSDTTSWIYSRKLYPELLEYSSIPEYKDWIYDLTVKLKDANLIKPKHYKKFRKQLVNEMKIEFKRQKTADLNEKSNSYGYGYGSAGSTALHDYVSLLIPFYKKDAEVKELFDKINTLEDPGTKAFIQAQLAKNNFETDKDIINTLASDPKKRNYLYGYLDSYGQLDQFPKEHLSQRNIAESIFLSNSSYPSIDSTIYLKEIILEEKNDKYVIYFFRTMKKVSSYGYYEDEKKEGDWGVQYIAFKLDDELEIVKNSYEKSSFRELDYEDKKEMKELEKTALDKVKYKKRKRVNPYADYYGEY